MTPQEEEELRMKTYDLAPLAEHEERDFDYRIKNLPPQFEMPDGRRKFALIFYRAGRLDEQRTERRRKEGLPL